MKVRIINCTYCGKVIEGKLHPRRMFCDKKCKGNNHALTYKYKTKKKSLPDMRSELETIITGRKSDQFIEGIMETHKTVEDISLAAELYKRIFD